MSPTIYFISMGAMFGTIIVVFAIRYFQAAAVAHADAAHTDAYRKLASDAVTGNTAALSAIQSELADIKARVAKVETILKTVE